MRLALIRGVGCSFFLSLLPLIFRIHFSLSLTKNINIFMVKNIANINVDILSAQKSAHFFELSKYW